MRIYFPHEKQQFHTHISNTYFTVLRDDDGRIYWTCSCIYVQSPDSVGCWPCCVTSWMSSEHACSCLLHCCWVSTDAFFSLSTGLGLPGLLLPHLLFWGRPLVFLDPANFPVLYWEYLWYRLYICICIIDIAAKKGECGDRFRVAVRPYSSAIFSVMYSVQSQL